MKDQTKIIAALLVGAAAGAAIGLLFTEKGEGVRDDLAEYVNDLIEKSRSKAQQTANNVRDYGNNMVGKAKSKINGVMADISDYKDQVTGTVEDYAGRAAQFGDDHVNEAKSKIKASANGMNNAVQDI